MIGVFYHVLEQSSEVLPLVPDLCCRFLVFPAFAGVVALHELADVFPHHVVVQSTRKLLLPGNTRTHTLKNRTATAEEGKCWWARRTASRHQDTRSDTFTSSYSAVS